MNQIKFIIFIATLIIYLLVIFGLIGPKGLREFFKKANKWMEHDDKSAIFPMDPYKPIGKEIKEAVRAAPERLGNYHFSYMSDSVAIAFLLEIFILVGILVFFFAPAF